MVSVRDAPRAAAGSSTAAVKPLRVNVNPSRRPLSPSLNAYIRLVSSVATTSRSSVSFSARTWACVGVFSTSPASTGLSERGSTMPALLARTFDTSRIAVIGADPP
jgi:hypothetical protein